MIAYVFPGQGSQVKGMGNQLFDKYPEYTKIADEILGYSIKDLCLNDPEELLGKTQFTQPALFTVNTLEYLEKIKNGIVPNYVAGHSLGEYNALFAAGVIDFATGLRLVSKRGMLMSQIANGGMAAILGFDISQVLEVLEKNHLENIYIANDNAPNQIVISGDKENIYKAKSCFEEAGAIKYVILKVSGAFHSIYMENVKNEFAQYLSSFEFNTPQMPVIANLTAKPYEESELKSTLVNQMISPVRWTDSIMYLLKRRVENITQIGPGSVLSGLTRQIKRAIKSDPQLLDNIEVATDISNEDTMKSQKIFPLGSFKFQETYGIQYPYLVGSMYKGISSASMVIQTGKAGILGFFGSGGLSIEEVERNIIEIQKSLSNKGVFGVNLIYNPNEPDMEERLVDLLLKYNVRYIEASAFIKITTALAKYKIKGLKRNQEGRVISQNRIFAKLSRPEVVENFLSPISKDLIEQLLSKGDITEKEAMLAREVPIANEIIAEADSAGHTDGMVPIVLWPAILRLKSRLVEQYNYPEPIHFGVAGGIGTPEAIIAAFVLGADFVVTGSINQCTIEAKTSSNVKELLANMEIHDSVYAPAGDMFELGARVQVLKKGTLFSVRANKLYEIYRNYNTLDAIDERTKKQIQTKYFGKTFDEIYEEIKSYHGTEVIEYAESNPKHKMALIFKWYFGYANKSALDGSNDNIVNYQIFSGPALGAFNEYVKGSELESWQNRHVDAIAIKLMKDAKKLKDKSN